MTGASWDVQLVAALTAAGFGALAALPTLLCALKLRPLARLAADFAAPAAGRVPPCGAGFFPNDGKETKGSPGTRPMDYGSAPLRLGP